MNLKTTLTIVTFLQFSILIGQSKYSTDSTVKVSPHWEKGDIHNVNLICSTESFVSGKTKNFSTTFSAKFNIIEKDSSGYKIEWVYTKCILSPDEFTVENIILSKLIGVKILYRLSNFGLFKELINVDEVQTAINKAIENLISNNQKNTEMVLQLKAAQQLFVTKKGIEIALLKHIKIYNLSYGYEYKKNIIDSHKSQLPNPFGGQPFESLEKIKLSKLDNANSICVIETTNVVQELYLKKTIVEYYKKISPKASKEIDIEFQNKKLEFTESSSHQIEFQKGDIQNARFSRNLNLGLQKISNIISITAVQ